MVQSSPIICVDENGYNSLIDLWQKGKVKLFVRRVRGDKIHRWIGDSNLIYSEDFHYPCADFSNRKIIKLDKDQEKYWAAKASSVFDSRISNNEVSEVTIESENLVTFLTASNIIKLFNYYNSMGDDYNYKSRENITDTQEKLGIKSMKLSRMN